MEINLKLNMTGANAVCLKPNGGNSPDESECPDFLLLVYNAAYLSWWMMRAMASNRTAFFALECWTFLDLGGSWALLRMVSRHSVRRLRSAASSAATRIHSLD